MNRAKQILEALLFASPEPIGLDRLCDIVGQYQAMSAREVRLHLAELSELYDVEQRGFALQKVAGGYALRTRPEFASYVQSLLKDRRAEKLSRAAAEVLAIIAYRQPVTRALVDRIRGVDSSGSLGQLQERGLIKTVGKARSAGRPVQYGTTRKFLEEFGLDGLEELPHRDRLGSEESAPA
jgi:segregation and condensation protein B